jgi:hypothetical protein
VAPSELSQKRIFDVDLEFLHSKVFQDLIAAT